MRVVVIAVAGALLCACSDPLEVGTDGPLLFQATVDGQLWTADTNAAWLSADGFFLASAYRVDRGLRARDGIGLKMSQLTGPGTYAFTSDLAIGRWGAYATYDPDQGTDTLFVSTPPNAGHLEITEIDTVNHRVAGRFEFQGVSGARRVRVRSGVFRLVYTPGGF